MSMPSVPGGFYIPATAMLAEVPHFRIHLTAPFIVL
jgi:hypothetical protein